MAGEVKDDDVIFVGPQKNGAHGVEDVFAGRLFIDEQPDLFVGQCAAFRAFEEGV